MASLFEHVFIVASGIFLGFGSLLLIWFFLDRSFVKPSFWAAVILWVGGLFLILSLVGFVSLDSKNLVTVTPEVDSAEEQSLEKDKLQFAFEEQTLDQTACFTWVMLNQGFRLEDIQVALNTVYALDTRESMSAIDVDKIFLEAEQIRTAWKESRSKVRSEQLCSAQNLREKNDALKKGLGLTYESRTRSWVKNLRRSVTWVCTVEGLHFFGIEVTKWWPNAWTLSPARPNIFAHPLEDL